MAPRKDMIRRIVDARRRRDRGALSDADSQDRTEAASLEQRIDHLESVVEGLQDALHRQLTRHDEQLAELARQLEPATLARALSDDARRRGLE